MKLAVIGLDCAPPGLVFDKFQNDLPNISRIMGEGIWAPLRSVHPPITVPAWTCMMSGLDPGQLGIYGFRNRKDYSYSKYFIADASAVKVRRVWDVLSDAGKKVILLGIPQTYPVNPINGYIVSDFLTPSTKSVYTYPVELKAEVERVSDGYVLDVEGFRTTDKVALLRRIYDKTRKNFAVAKHLVKTKPWDFFMMVEMGVDRIHHGFWSFMDPLHPKFEKGNPFEKAIQEYYRYLDWEVGELMDHFPEDTEIIIVSDHGAKRLEGGICFNEWLIREGYLKLNVAKETLKEPQPLKPEMIDWPKTQAWGEGGYYGRLFLNVRGREPLGNVAPEDYDNLRAELIDKIEAIEDPQGRNIGSKVYRPERIYREVNGVPPDLMVYFGDLYWRSVGSVGFDGIHTFDNDTGPDEANHDWEGIFIKKSPGTSGMKYDEGKFNLLDVAPFILDFYGCGFSLE